MKVIPAIFEERGHRNEGGQSVTNCHRLKLRAAAGER